MVADVDYQTESKRDKFLRLAESRTNMVITKLRTLANCSNPYVYEYTEEDVSQIFRAIEEELKLAKAQFRTPMTRGRFELRPRSQSSDNRPGESE